MPSLVPLPTLADNIGDSSCSVAFAWRCASRVAALYTDWPACPANARNAVLDAMAAIEEGITYLSKVVVPVNSVNENVRTVPIPFRPVLEAVLAACKATNAFCRTPVEAAQSNARAFTGREIWPESVQAALKAFESGRRIRWRNQVIDISSEIRQDLLIAKAEAERRLKIGSLAYYRSEPVHPALFGPLWPDDPPIGWGSDWVPPDTPSPVPAVANIQAGTPAAGASDEAPELVRGRLLKALQRAVEAAFDQSSLAQLVRFDLGIRLDLVALGPNFQDVVFRLLRWAEQRGRLRDLVRAVALARDQNPDVQSAANALLRLES
jgi:hypothetical protein